jgi:uncharacterized membrane protein YeaQ/YmgE (transglycosylase-associated protein family)
MRTLKMSILTFLLFLIVAAVCAGIAEYVVPGRVPGGFLTLAIIGIIGAWIGGSLFGTIGPALFGVTLIPTILGAAILVFVLSLVSGSFAR